MRYGIMLSAHAASQPIWDDAYGLYRALKTRGSEVLLFTSDGRSRAPGRTYHYADIRALLDPSDMIVYHLIDHDPAGLNLLRSVDCAIILRYHGMEDPSHFPGASADILLPMKDARESLFEVRELRYRKILCTSHKQKDYLESLSFPEVSLSVIPPFSRAETLCRLGNDQSVVDLLKKHSYNILVLGRVSPEKDISAIIRATANTYYETKADVFLHVVGSHDSPRIQKFLDGMGQEIEANEMQSRTHMYGFVDDRALSTFIRECDLLVSLNASNRFTLAISEAAASGLPIVVGKADKPDFLRCDGVISVEGSDTLKRILAQFIRRDATRRGLRQEVARFFAERLSNHAVSRLFLSILDALSVSDKSMIAMDAEKDKQRWFNLPDVGQLISEFNTINPIVNTDNASGLDARRAMIRWAILEGPQHSEYLHQYVRSKSFRDYLSSIEVPVLANHLLPEEKLIWNFDLFANAKFDLTSSAGVRRYRTWFSRYGKSLLMNLEIFNYQEKNIDSYLSSGD